MLIDAGDNSKGTTVQLYLQKRGIETLDYVIGTHPHADHIGGLDVIITKFDCDMILMPKYETGKKTYRDVMDAMEYRGYQKTVPEVGDRYLLGDATLTIIAVPEFDYEEEINNYSIGIRLTHGNIPSFLWRCGERNGRGSPAKRCEYQSDVLKISHHGSYSFNHKRVFESGNPSYAVISCGRKIMIMDIPNARNTKQIAKRQV